MYSIIAIGTLLFAANSVYIGGENVGFDIRPSGLIVADTYDVVTKSEIYNPKNSDIRVGDIITYMGDKKVQALADVSSYINTMSGDEIILTISRSSTILNKKLKIIVHDGKKKTGLIVKERLLGVGTISYYNPQDKTYGALGHPVRESESMTLEMVGGTLYNSLVNGITPSVKNDVGEKNATLDTSKVLGDVKRNTEYGIVGSYNELPKGAVLYEVAKPNEVKLGRAEIYTVIMGDKKQKFDIEITSLKDQTSIATKGLTFRVSDQDLLKISGGIVAGMSGSPIVQEGKLVGAVTHVIVSSPNKGYGIYMEHMINGLSSQLKK